MPVTVSGRRTQPPRGAALLALALAVVLPALAAAGEDVPGIDPLDRVQLHRNANRGVPYLPLARQGADAGEATLTMRPIARFELDGDPLENAYAGLRPIDVEGDGRFGWVHFNGQRFLQVLDAAGRRMWRVDDPGGRLHEYQAGTRRDAVVVTDLDGVPGQDVAHCWTGGDGGRELVFRRGRDGTVIRSVPLEAGAGAECQMAAFRVADGPAGTILLVAARPRGAAAAACARDFVGYWSRVVAYDLAGNRLWDRDTCDAGHHAWPVDADRDGRAEAIFVGKYLLRPDGSLQCSLAGWPADDHVDGLAVAEFPDSGLEPGPKAVAVGLSGAAMFDARTCRALWRVPGGLIRDPQHVAVAKLDPGVATPLILVGERGSVPGARSFVLTAAQGLIVAARANGATPMQNADLDGARGVDEAVGGFGVVTDRFDNLRLGRDWYWDLRGARTAETRRGPYPNDYDRWQAFPLVFDYDGDGRDEIVQWGQSLIVVGKVGGTDAAAALAPGRRRR